MGAEWATEGAQARVGDRVDEGAQVRQDGADGFRVVRDRCLKFLSSGVGFPLLQSLICR